MQHMPTAHDIIAGFARQHAIDWSRFHEWFNDTGYTEDDANRHDSRFLNILESYVRERDAGHV